jgi:predicted ATPase
MRRPVNNWYVVTGAPSSGKTTTLEYLKKKGYKVYFEWARIYIDQEIRRGKTLEEIRKDEFLFQKKILKLKINFEKKLVPSDLIFIERGIPDSTAYMGLAGGSDPSLKSALKNCSYRKVFLMEILKFKKDYARTESEEQAFLLDELIEKSYIDLGIETLRVPMMTVAKRAKFILDNL